MTTQISKATTTKDLLDIFPGERLRFIRDKKGATPMITSTLCRVSQDELDHDRAQRLDQQEGLSDTPEQIVADKVAEIMADQNANDDARVVLMESERFTKALWTHFTKRHDGSNPEDTEASVNLNSVAETVLSEWVEGQL